MNEASRPYSRVRRELAMGYIAPYHQQLPKDDAEQIACAILYDLCDRRGVKHELLALDDEIRAEIVYSLAALIREGMKGNMLKPDPGDWSDDGEKYSKSYAAMMKQLRDEYEEAMRDENPF